MFRKKKPHVVAVAGKTKSTVTATAAVVLHYCIIKNEIDHEDEEDWRGKARHWVDRLLLLSVVCCLLLLLMMMMRGRKTWGTNNLLQANSRGPLLSICRMLRVNFQSIRRMACVFGHDHVSATSVSSNPPTMICSSS